LSSRALILASEAWRQRGVDRGDLALKIGDVAGGNRLRVISHYIALYLPVRVAA
jgi:hypothetical protein